MSGFYLHTERLSLREMTREDFPALCNTLQDIEVMYAWEHAFSEEEVSAWIERNLARYAEFGYGHWLVLDRATGECVGQAGLLPEEIEGEQQLGIGWILCRKHWGKGYAVEAARACVDHAFATLHAPQLIADIRPENTASIRVAEKLGMSAGGVFDKIYRNKVMPHRLYTLKNPLTRPDTQQ